MGACGSSQAKPKGAAPRKAAKVTAELRPRAALLATDDEADYDTAVAELCPADVYMFSGCKDDQESDDLSEVGGLDSTRSGAGGACTTALLNQTQTQRQAGRSWLDVLAGMVEFLESHGLQQRPMLSTSRPFDLRERYSLFAPGGGVRRALLVGINYVSYPQYRLNGSVNDAAAMRRYLLAAGFPAEGVEMLVDDAHKELAEGEKPTRANLLDAIGRLTAGAQAGDSLFFYYSGHGGQVPDEDGDEEDGLDEVLMPCDYLEQGIVTDDDLFLLLCASLPAQVRLVCVIDCCHSGTMLDLPYAFEATRTAVDLAKSASQLAMLHPQASFRGKLERRYSTMRRPPAERAKLAEN